MKQHESAVPAEVPEAAAAKRYAKVFVSYSRKDLGFAEMLVSSLAERGFDAFLDKTDIAPGEPWKERLAALIAVADTLVFVASPDSIASSICAWELEESARLGKRVIPVVSRRIADADAPPALGRLNWVFCTQSDDREAALSTLDRALHTDLPLGARAYAARRACAALGRAGQGEGGDLARRGPRSRRALARPTAGRMPMRRPTCTRISSGRAGGRRSRASAIGSAVRCSWR